MQKVSSKLRFDKGKCSTSIWTETFPVYYLCVLPVTKCIHVFLIINPMKCYMKHKLFQVVKA